MKKKVSKMSVRPVYELMYEIASRAKSMQHPDEMSVIITDLIHLYAQRDVDLEMLLHAAPQTFIHDVWGLRSLIDRETGKIPDVFILQCHLRKEMTDICPNK